jgi:GR25 family glycosyltransferase involved in LPS biosynthesis
MTSGEMKIMNLPEYFDRISIIHLPERRDRYESLRIELRRLGIDIKDPKIEIPYAPKPADSNGFTSRGVYGNFLSHLEILRRARDEGLSNVWVLEDDAIFSRRMCRTQAQVVERLKRNDWDLCFFGHSLTKEISGQPTGLLATRSEFIWAHCYAVNAKALPRIVAYLERALVLPEGHPDGGRLYIDAAFTLFRRQNPDAVTLVGNPALSIQKGCFSSLNERKWYDSAAMTRPLASAARRVRDGWWKVTA